MRVTAICDEDMAAESKKNPLANLMTLPGIGKGKAQNLYNAGIKSASSVAKASVKRLESAGLSAGLIAKIKSTKPTEKVAPKKKATPKKKAAPKKKATPKKKAAPKKKAPAKKKNPSKAKSKPKPVDTGTSGSRLKVPSLKEMLKRINANR